MSEKLASWVSLGSGFAVVIKNFETSSYIRPKYPVCICRETSVSRGFGWRIHCGVEVTESSTNKQHTLS